MHIWIYFHFSWILSWKPYLELASPSSLISSTVLPPTNNAYSLIKSSAKELLVQNNHINLNISSFWVYNYCNWCEYINHRHKNTQVTKEKISFGFQSLTVPNAHLNATERRVLHCTKVLSCISLLRPLENPTKNYSCRGCREGPQDFFLWIWGKAVNLNLSFCSAR